MPGETAERWQRLAVVARAGDHGGGAKQARHTELPHLGDRLPRVERRRPARVHVGDHARHPQAPGWKANSGNVHRSTSPGSIP